MAPAPKKAPRKAGGKAGGKAGAKATAKAAAKGTSCQPDQDVKVSVAEDIFVRAAKLRDLKVVLKEPKSDFTAEEWCIPPSLHSAPELKQTIHYYKQCGVIFYNQRDLKIPSQVQVVDDSCPGTKLHAKVEVQELSQFLKSFVQQASVRTGQFLKQLEKKELQQSKRDEVQSRISDIEASILEDEREAKEYARREPPENGTARSKICLPDAPQKNALVIVEVSVRLKAAAKFVKEEVGRFLRGVISEGVTETFNLVVFSADEVLPWCPNYQPAQSAKKGVVDAVRWLDKNLSAKACASQQWPPKWLEMFAWTLSNVDDLPERMFLCCSRAPPEDARSEVLKLLSPATSSMAVSSPQPLQEDRSNGASAAPRGQAVPLNVVTFDPVVVNDEEERRFLRELVGDQGSFVADTSHQDALAAEKLLKRAQAKKKRLVEISKKLSTMEDLSKGILTDRENLRVQIALQRMLENDLDVCNWALHQEELEPTRHEP